MVKKFHNGSDKWVIGGEEYVEKIEIDIVKLRDSEIIPPEEGGSRQTGTSNTL